MEHIMPDDELWIHQPDVSCHCKPRLIFDKPTGDLIALHYDAFGNCMNDEDALKMLELEREDEDSEEIEEND